MAQVKKLPDPPRVEPIKGQESMFTDSQLWEYKYGSSAKAKDVPKPRESR